MPAPVSSLRRHLSLPIYFGAISWNVLSPQLVASAAIPLPVRSDSLDIASFSSREQYHHSNGIERRQSPQGDAPPTLPSVPSPPGGSDVDASIVFPGNPTPTFNSSTPTPIAPGVYVFPYCRLRL